MLPLIHERKLRLGQLLDFLGILNDLLIICGDLGRRQKFVCLGYLGVKAVYLRLTAADLAAQAVYLALTLLAEFIGILLSGAASPPSMARRRK